MSNNETGRRVGASTTGEKGLPSSKISAKWKDESSYSRGERGRIEPNVWVLSLPTTRISVHRHIYSPGKWLLTCRRLGIEMRELEAIEVGEAIKEALRLLDLAVIMVREDLKAAALAPCPPTTT